MEEKQLLAEKGKLAHVYASGIRAVMNRAAELKREGKPVISFSAGEPDFDTPADIRHAASAAMENHMTHYSSARGELCLREEIAKKFSVIQEWIMIRKQKSWLHRADRKPYSIPWKRWSTGGMKSLSLFRPLETMKIPSFLQEAHR